MQHFQVGKGALAPLSEQDEIFVAEYLVHFNALKAARAAGYTKDVAKNKSHTWVSMLGPKPHVARAIRTALQARLNRLNVTADAVIAELAKLGFSNMLNYVSFDQDGVPFFDLTNLNHDTAAAIKTLTIDEYKEGRGEQQRELRRVKIELYDKKAALVSLGQHLGIFGKAAGPANPDDPDAPPVGNGGDVTVNNFNISLIPAGKHYQDGTLIEGQVVELGDKV